MVQLITRKSKRARNQKLIAVAVLFVIGVLVVYAIGAKPAGYPARTPQAGSLADVRIIDENSQLALHHHIHLDVFINGSAVTVPADLGHLPDGRLYTIHTHEIDGLIHIETPVATDPFTLGEIFEVWGWPLDSNHIFDQTGPVTLYINNGNTPHLFDTSYALQEHDEIAIVFGPAPAGGIPSSYNFPSGA